MILKQKSLSLPRNLVLGTFGKLLIVFHNKGNSAIPPLLNKLEAFSSASDKTEVFVKNFSENSNLAKWLIF